MANLIVESLYEKYGATTPDVKTQKRKALVEHIDLSDKLGNIVRPGGMRDESKICDVVANHTAYEEMFREIGYDDDCSLIFYLDDADAMNIQSIVDDINDEFSAKDMPNYAQVCSYTNSPAIEVQELYRSINAYIENESLTEARNPENDELNKIIHNWGETGELTSQDLEMLNKHGIEYKIDPAGTPVLYGGGSAITRAMVTSKKRHPDYDFANKTMKPGSEIGDVELSFPTALQFVQPGFERETYPNRKDAGYRASINQLRSLQPNWEKTQEIKRGMRYGTRKDTKKKNESLSLKERYTDERGLYTPNARGVMHSLVDEGLFTAEELFDYYTTFFSDETIAKVLDEIKRDYDLDDDFMPIK